MNQIESEIAGAILYVSQQHGWRTDMHIDGACQCGKIAYEAEVDLADPRTNAAINACGSLAARTSFTIRAVSSTIQIEVSSKDTSIPA
jgi:hypothetical protein